MAAKTVASTTSAAGATSPSGLDELLFQNDTVSLCLLVNRRHGNVRVIDFRAGPTVAKRNFILAAAKREGLEKVFTLVERDEVGTWARLGFAREGSIPGFYRRSDAWIMGAVVSQVGPFRAESLYDEDDEEPEAETSAAQVTAERVINKAKRLLKDGGDLVLPAVKVGKVTLAEARKAVGVASKNGRALTGFETFSRDASRTYYSVTTKKKGFCLYAATEMQECFGNSMFEILEGPRNEEGRLSTTAAVLAICEMLAGQGCASTFTMAPADDPLLTSVFLATGFRRSAVLARHLVVGGERRDGILWSRKLVTDA